MVEDTESHSLVVPRRVGIVGGTGFIGSRITAAFRHRGWITRVFTLEDPLLKFDGQLSEDTESLDALVWSASRNTPSSAAKDPRLADEEFAEVDMTLAAVRERVPGIHAAFLSSGGTVYGPSDQAHREEESLSPATPYGKLKVDLERLFLDTFDKASVLRVANAYGPGQAGQNAQGVLAHWLPALRRNQPIVVFGNPAAARDYIFVDDVADALTEVLFTNEGLAQHSIFNVGSGVATSLESLLDVVREVTGCTLHVDYQRGRGFDLLSSHLDITSITSRTSWRPTTNLVDGVAAMWEWVRQTLPDSDVPVN